jgi:hypothetical protein
MPEAEGLVGWQTQRCLQKVSSGGIMSFVNDATTWEGAQVSHQVLSVQESKWVLGTASGRSDVRRHLWGMGSRVLSSTLPLGRYANLTLIAYPSPPKRGFTKSWHSTSPPYPVPELSLSSSSRTSLIQKTLCSIETIQNSSKMEKPRLRMFFTSLFSAQHC